jgi:hypothetical protein
LLVRLPGDVAELAHEAREALELRPLVVNDPDRDAHVERFDDVNRLAVVPPLLAIVAEPLVASPLADSQTTS